jgi:hypothetical protein
MTTDKQKEARKRLKEMAESLGIRMVEDVDATLDPTLPMGADPGTWDKLIKPVAQYDDHGNLKKPVKPRTNRINTNLILENDPQYKSLCFWEHANQILWRGQLVSDDVIEEMALDMEVRYRYTVTNKALEGAVLRVSHMRVHTPIKDWLESLPEWDGVKRIENLAENILMCETMDEYRPLIQRMSALMWISFVARIYQPGCHVHTLPIFVGPKGVGKSMTMEIMAAQYFNRSDIPIGTKDALEKIHQSGTWIWEIAELKDLQGKSADLAKQFMEGYQSKGNAEHVLWVRQTIINSWMMVQSGGFGCSKSSPKSTSNISKPIESKYGVRRSTFTNLVSNGGWIQSLRRC